MEEEKKDSTDQTGSEEQTKENQEQEQGVSKELQSAIAQKEHWRKKYDEAIASKDAVEEKQQPTDEKEMTAVTYASKSDLEKIEFQIQHKELDAEAVSTVMDLSKSKGISLEEALKLPVMESYVKDLQQKANDEAANPTSGRSGGVTPPKPISEMTSEEHKAYAKKFGIN